MPPLAENARPVTLLIDPIFSERASPVDVAGPVRMLGNPCSLHDIPQIDFLFISHNQWVPRPGHTQPRVLLTLLFLHSLPATTTWMQIL